MERPDFTRLLDQHFAEISQINRVKGHDYAGDDDALSNFKKGADSLAKIVQNDPVLAKWYVYFDKHLSAIITFLEEGDVKSEPIEGRIHDAILYLFLLLGLIEEKKLEPWTGEDPETAHQIHEAQIAQATKIHLPRFQPGQEPAGTIDAQARAQAVQDIAVEDPATAELGGSPPSMFTSPQYRAAQQAKEAAFVASHATRGSER